MRPDQSRGRGRALTLLICAVAVTTFLVWQIPAGDPALAEPNPDLAAGHHHVHAYPPGAAPAPRSVAAYPAPGTPAPRLAYPYPTGVAVTPAARATRVSSDGRVRVDLPLVPTPPGGTGEVRLSVSLAPPGLNAGLTHLSDRSRLIRALFVELTFGGVANHDTLPQPAMVTFDFTRSDVRPLEDPLSVKLYLSIDGTTWEEVPTQVTDLGGGNYRAVGTVTHFSFVAMATRDTRIMIPVSFKTFASE